MDHIPVARLVDHAAQLFGIPADVITGPRRTAQIFHARSAVALAARVAGYSYPKIGQAMGRNVGSVFRACERAEYTYRRDPEYKRHCDMLIGMAREFQEACNDNAPESVGGLRSAL
ncbi:helix-turn-helix domain-containing protein [Croceicoccus bisphenolivorans]|uniref:helix-turn-helix domain-containing protein n=1 Tax=Croceicoccus bisphenolivorans TaxID=1783232 RepID=UPI000832903B|nr:helix-turn-helix domain-containing protein [Croceicoccus bisphenolivorans]